MKTFIALSLLYLTLANQGILSTIGDQIHPYQQVIVALSEVASKDFNFQQLFVALDELAESFKTRKNEENAFYDQIKYLYLYQLSFFNIFKNRFCQQLLINFNLDFKCTNKNINNIKQMYNTTISLKTFYKFNLYKFYQINQNRLLF